MKVMQFVLHYFKSECYFSTLAPLDRKPTEQEVDIARKVIFDIIDNKDFTAFDFWEKLTKFKRMNYITPLNLVSQDGLNILQASIEKGRFSFLIHILHIGWWNLLAKQIVSQSSPSEFKGKTAKQIAELKKARKPLDEFNTHNEWEASLSPLMKACRTGDLSKARVLMDHAATEAYDVDHQSANALYWAVVYGSLELITFLESRGLNIKMQTKKKETLLHLAACLGHSHLIEVLVQTYGIEPNVMDVTHKTANER